MSKPPSRRRKKKSDQPSDVSALIEEARKSRAIELNLSIKGLTKLPESIGQLTQLRTLALFGNKLTELPDFIGQLTQLSSLHVNENDIKILPESLKSLTSLNELFLRSNNLLGLPSEVLGLQWIEVILGEKQAAKPADILDYYFRTRGEPPTIARHHQIRFRTHTSRHSQSATAGDGSFAGIS